VGGDEAPVLVLVRALVRAQGLGVEFLSPSYSSEVELGFHKPTGHGRDDTGDKTEQ
jgi:hypothetical protein